MVQAEVADRLVAGPGSQDLRRAVGEAGLVLRGAAASARVPPTVFWPVPNVDSGLVALHAPRAAGHDRVPRSRCSPWSTPPSRSAARCCARPWPGCSARPRPRRRRWRPPGSTRRRAARCSTVTDFARIAEARSRCGTAGIASRHGITGGRGRGRPRPGRRARSTSPCASVRARPDGYHPLATVFQAVSLFDEVEAALGRAGPVHGAGARRAGRTWCPTDERNLAVKAARLLAATARRRPPLGAELVIRKAIPVTGGMAGGSADAAGALLACAVLWDLDISPDELRDLGAQLGADVPFCLVGRHGARHRPRRRAGPGAQPRHLPLGAGVQRRRAVHAGGVRQVRRARTRAPTRPEVPPELLNALVSGDAAALGRCLTNDLQAGRAGAASAAGPAAGGRQRARRRRRDRLRLRSDHRLPRRQRVGRRRPVGEALQRGPVPLRQAGHRPRPRRPPGRLIDRSAPPSSSDPRCGVARRVWLRRDGGSAAGWPRPSRRSRSPCRA